MLSKQGLTGGFSPIAGNTIRMLAAVIILWGLVLAQGKARRTLDSMRANPRVLGMLSLAAFTGPVLGVTSSLFALQHTQSRHRQHPDRAAAGLPAAYQLVRVQREIRLGRCTRYVGCHRWCGIVILVIG